jgi:hypothetical protein
VRKPTLKLTFRVFFAAWNGGSNACGPNREVRAAELNVSPCQKRASNMALLAQRERDDKLRRFERLCQPAYRDLRAA